MYSNSNYLHAYIYIKFLHWYYFEFTKVLVEMFYCATVYLSSFDTNERREVTPMSAAHLLNKFPYMKTDDIYAVPTMIY